MLFWQEFGILFVASLLGSAAVLPYGLRIAQKKPLRFSLPIIVLISMLQNAVIFFVVTALGIAAAHAVGLGAPYLEALLSGSVFPTGDGLYSGVAYGALAGAFLLIADMFFLPYWPKPLLEVATQTTLPENFLASFYGGINEELLMRFFGLSGLIWLISLFARPSVAIFWIVNVVMAIIFGIGHLPALKQAAGTISRIMLARTILLNAPVGLVCGWLFWNYGIESAILAHFAADIVYHVIGTVVLRRRVR